VCLQSRLGERGAPPSHRSPVARVNPSLQSALFYSLSTVAQTLAGAMGLLGAIVLFALQESARSIERAATKLTEIPLQSVSPLYLRHLLTRRSFHEIASHYGDMLRPGQSSETSTEALVQYSTLSWELEHDNSLRRWFSGALLASGIVIGFSLICCALSPQLAARRRVGQAVLVSDVLGAISCLVMYGFLLRVMLRASPQQAIPSA